MHGLTLDPRPDAAAQARAFVTGALTEVTPGLVDDARLVVTELVTNALLHGEPPLAVRAGVLPDGAVRVEVHDRGRQLLVLPAPSPDAMTGRGLRLVAAVSSAWGVGTEGPAGKTVWAELRGEGEDAAALAPVDLDVLLGSWDADDDADAPVTVRLGPVPTGLLLAAKQHLDNVVRELTLERAGARGEPLPEELSRLIETVTGDFALARTELKRLAAAAATREEVETHLVLTLPRACAGAGERYLAALDDADLYVRTAGLLTLSPPRAHQVFRRWYVGALVDALRTVSAGGEPVAPRPFAEVLAEEVSALAQLQGVAHRLSVLQQVNADLARSRTEQGMAAVVLRAAMRELGALSARVYVAHGDVLRSVAADGGDPRWTRRYQEVPLDSALPAAAVYRTGRALVLRDLAEILDRFPDLDGSYDTERSLHVVPLTAGAHHVGVLSVAFPPQGRLDEDARAPFVQALADVLAQALERDVPAVVDYVALFRALPTAYMVMDRDLVFVEANDAYLATVGRRREELVGRHVFEMFPPTADALEPGTQISRVQRSFERARDTGEIDVMPVQKYDIPDPVNGGFSERYWSLISVPVPDADGRVSAIAQRAEDITDFVRERERGARAEQDSAAWRRRAAEVEADLFARAQELEAAVVARDRAARRLASLAAVALDLTTAESVGDLSRIVFGTGLPVLGADGGAISVRDDAAGVVRLAVSENLGPEVQVAYSELPLSSPLPAAHVARTGETVLFPDRATGLAWAPETQAVYEVTERDAWATLPLHVGERLLGALVVSWREERQFADDELELLAGFAAQVAQALLRVQVTSAQRDAAAAAQRMSETLQRSLLSDPPELQGVEIAVRYRPALAGAHVGGDWYDAFRTSDGSTLIAIGDITGHDRVAAAAMGQVRNLVRGMAFHSTDGPAALLGRLDATIQGLDVGVLATAVLARLEPVPGEDPAGGWWRLVWSNAGHPPPVLVAPPESPRLLATEADLMLGIDPDTARGEQSVVLPPGSTVVLYTDGLVERRDSDLGRGLDDLLHVLARLPDRSPDAVADGLLTALDDGGRSDDTALLVVRTRPPAPPV